MEDFWSSIIGDASGKPTRDSVLKSFCLSENVKTRENLVTNSPIVLAFIHFIY